MITPSQEWSIDEQLCLFTGRYANKVVMKDKPAGCGIKCIGMADSNTKLPLWWSTVSLGEEKLVIEGMSKYSAMCALFLSQPNNKYIFIGTLYTTYELHNYCTNRKFKLVSTVCALLHLLLIDGILYLCSYLKSIMLNYLNTGALSNLLL